MTQRATAVRPSLVASLLAATLALPTPVHALLALTVDDSIRPGSEAAGTVMWDTGTLGGWAYTMADDGVHGHELWRTNGPSTELVENINLTSSGAGSSYPYGFVQLGDWLYFSADDGVHGYELWRTNGSVTALVKDVNENGSDGSAPNWLTRAGDYLFFAANDGVHGEELWRTDGTTTALVRDINPLVSGVPDGSSPGGLVSFGGRLYFSATDGVHGTELWAIDGTDGTTWTTWDLNANSDGADPSSPQQFSALGSWLYFSADGGDGQEPWRMGADLVPQQITNINATDGSYPFSFTLFNGSVYFGANDGSTGYEVWRTDGTTSELLADIFVGGMGSYPDQLTVFNGWLYFQANDNVHGAELWRTDGAASSPTVELVEDLNSIESEPSSPWPLRVIGDALWFVATTGGGTGYHLFRIGNDGTRTSYTVPGTNAGIGCMCSPLKVLGGRIFTPVFSDETGGTFAYIDEPTYVLPETNRETVDWTRMLAKLAAMAAVVGVTLRAQRNPVKPWKY